jgi:hypothetical protein
MSGDRVAHPLLMTTANIDADVRMKASYNSLLLIALLPVPKFIGIQKALHGVLENRLTHACLDLICEPLKMVAHHGTWMSDHVGDVRYCYTPIVGYIADTPEAGALVGVSGKTSHLTHAFGPHFGDDFRHPPRTASDIISPLLSLSSSIDPWDLALYTKEARNLYRLNGVDKPFWRDWTLPNGIPPNPHQIFPIEILHHFHKFFWDHEVKWCIRALGEGEIDFRFALLQPRCGYRRFPAGISTLKQVTGREHRNIQRHILGVIAGAAPLEFIVCIRALLDIRYLAQMHRVTTDVLEEIGAALRTFHTYKNIIISHQYRVGKGKKPISHFEIPKLELLQSVVASIQWSGSLPQWSADSTEHSHGKFVKKPKSRTNGNEYYSQICRLLDREEKARMFNIATAIHESAPADPSYGAALDIDDPVLDVDEWLTGLPVVESDHPGRRIPNFFSASASDPLTSTIPHTFATFTTGFHLKFKPDITQVEADVVAADFNIPNLHTSIQDFLSHYLHDQETRKIAGRLGPPDDTPLPFNEIRVWYSVQVQNFNSDGDLRPPQRLFASPPSDDWPFGRCDTLLFRESVGPGSPQRPGLGLKG